MTETVEACFCKSCKDQTTNIGTQLCDNCEEIEYKISRLNIFATTYFLRVLAERYTTWEGYPIPV